MVATWNPAADATYYVAQAAYYLGGREPTGVWYGPGSAFVADGDDVDRATFERLFAGRDDAGRSLHSGAGAKHHRTSAFDVTLSAPRSVSLLWALGTETSRVVIEAAQFKAVRATIAMLEREAAFARRGRNGSRIEHVQLTVATFQHGESRPAEHADGRRFADPNLHTHAVIMNLAARADGTVGALHSVILRDWKMSAGALYHAALAAELQVLGFELEEISRNGTFEIAGVPQEAIGYFSARRAKIEDELREAGTTSGEAVALAAAIARSTRLAKSAGTEPRETVWRRAAADFGLDVASVFAHQREHRSKINHAAGERLLADRLAALPRTLTETRSVVDRRELVRSVAEALVGTGIGAERVEPIVTDLVDRGHVVELGHDPLGQRRYSTREMMRIEREVVATADRLVRDHRYASGVNRLARLASA